MTDNPAPNFYERHKGPIQILDDDFINYVSAPVCALHLINYECVYRVIFIIEAGGCSWLDSSSAGFYANILRRSGRSITTIDPACNRVNVPLQTYARPAYLYLRNRQFIYYIDPPGSKIAATRNRTFSTSSFFYFFR